MTSRVNCAVTTRWPIQCSPGSNSRASHASGTNVAYLCSITCRTQNGNGMTATRITVLLDVVYDMVSRSRWSGWRSDSIEKLTASSLLLKWSDEICKERKQEQRRNRRIKEGAETTKRKSIERNRWVAAKRQTRRMEQSHFYTDEWPIGQLASKSTKIPWSCRHKSKCNKNNVKL